MQHRHVLLQVQTGNLFEALKALLHQSLDFSLGEIISRMSSDYYSFLVSSHLFIGSGRLDALVIVDLSGQALPGPQAVLLRVFHSFVGTITVEPPTTKCVLRGSTVHTMRLSAINFFKKSVNGHIFRGKYRLVKRVSLQAMNTLQKEYEIQERNMLLLRHPFLTAVSEICVLCILVRKVI